MKEAEQQKESKQQKSPGRVSKASTNVSHFPVCVLIVWSGTRKGTLLHLAESRGHLNTSIRIRKRYLDPFILNNRWTYHTLKYFEIPVPPDSQSPRTCEPSKRPEAIFHISFYLSLQVPRWGKGSFCPEMRRSQWVCHGSTADLHLFSWYVQSSCWPPDEDV